MTDTSTPKALGRTLKLFLADGSANGVITAELGNWSGKVLVANRTALPDLTKRPEVRQTGVYMLLGIDPNEPDRALAYIGEGDDVSRRLITHDSDETKLFFSRACVLVSKDENLTKAHVRYLEARLISLAKSAKRATLTNGTAPEEKGLPEAEVADIERYLSEIQIVLPVLGVDLLKQTEALGTKASSRPDETPIFEFTEAENRALAKEVDGEFIVLKGSTARIKETDSISASQMEQRRRLLGDGDLEALADDPKYYQFSRNVAFNSPSGAAVAIYGGSISGPKTWRVQGNKQTYKEWREEQFAMDAPTDETEG